MFYDGRNFEPEMQFQTSRSSGPGGQNVNKTESKVELRFDVQKSELLTNDEKELILIRLQNKISSEGILIISSQESRSQLDNKLTCIEKFYKLLSQALKPEIRRKPTRVPLSVKLKRLESKKYTSEKKQNRNKNFFD